MSLESLAEIDPRRFLDRLDLDPPGKYDSCSDSCCMKASLIIFKEDGSRAGKRGRLFSGNCVGLFNDETRKKAKRVYLGVKVEKARKQAHRRRRFRRATADIPWTVCRIYVRLPSLYLNSIGYR